MPWEVYRNTVRTCRDGIRKAKVLTELNLVRDAKNNKKGFYRYIGQKRKTKESVPPLKNNRWRTGSKRQLLCFSLH